MAAFMQDAMDSLVYGYFSVALIPLTNMSKLLDTFKLYGLHEAIPEKTNGSVLDL